MATARNWDKVRGENKIRRAGALPARVSGWEPQEPPSKWRPPVDQVKARIARKLSRETFLCNGCRITVGIDLPSFAQLNHLKPNNPQTRRRFHEVQDSFYPDFNKLTGHIALTKRKDVYFGSLDLQRECALLEQVLGRSLSFTLSL